MKKRLLTIMAGLLFSLALSAQVITVTPPLPQDIDSVTVIFDATKGNQGLMNYTGDVYAHTGVITDKSATSSDWKYVKAAWGVNIPDCKMTRIDANHYFLKIKPSIRDYYQVASTDTIKKLAFVFRSALPYTGTTYYEGKDVNNTDIFYTVYSNKVNVSIVLPANNFSLDTAGQPVPVQINSLNADSIGLFLNGSLLKTSYNGAITDTLTASGTHLNTLVALAWQGNHLAADTTYFLVGGTTQTASLPAGVRDGINYTSDTSVTFVLYAPYKKSIYLIGEFNNWVPDSVYMLNRDGDRFWITLNRLTPGKEYAFQYLIDGNLRIADPYCDKILDPWNDQYISSTIYPNLKPYPVGKTTEIAGVIQTGQPSFNWQANSFTPPDQHNLIIYELLIRDFTDNRDIKTVMDTLSYLKRLGVNAIELMPFNEFEGNDSWGYNPDFYFAPDKAYGTKDDYKRFIDACHKNGIAVIQDIVLNHSYGQSPLVRMYFDGTNPTAQNPWYNITSPNPTYSWGYDFNHQSPATKYFVSRVLSYWLSQYKIDGFRFDFSKGFTNTPGDGWAYDASRIAILENYADSIWKTNPKAYVILEHFTENSEETVLANYGMMPWGNLNCAYNQASMGFASGPCSWDISWISFANRGWTNPNLVGYMESHDEERLMFKNLTYGNSSGTYNIKNLSTALKRQELVSCLFYTVPGPKMLWEFGELGYDVSIETGGRTAIKPTHWDYYLQASRRELYNVTAALINLKKTEPVFTNGSCSMDVSGAVKQITLTDNTTEIHVVTNCDVVSNTATVHFGTEGKWYDYFGSDSLIVSPKDYNIQLLPGAFRIYSNRKLSAMGNMLITRLPNIESQAAPSAYPNPTNGPLTIDAAGSFVTLEVLSSDGRLLKKFRVNDSAQVDISSLQEGMYFLRFTNRSGNHWIQKIVKN